MKTIILAGGQGLRIREYSDRLPKALIPIGNIPIVQHVMSIYAEQGFSDFILVTGHLGYRVDKWLETANLPWSVEIVHTGENTPTGGRVKVLANTGKLPKETFFLTYADGLADINLNRLLATHRASDSLVTITAIRPRSQFGILDLSGDQVIGFREKPILDMWANAGFMVMEPFFAESPSITLDSDLEREVLPRLVDIGKLAAYRHIGYFQQMDSIKDRDTLEEAWEQGRPWTSREEPAGWQKIM